MIGERHVVWQTRTWQFDRNVVFEISGGSNHTVVHIGGFFGVVKEEHLTGRFINLCMCRDPPTWSDIIDPIGFAAMLQCAWIKLVDITALIEAASGDAIVNHNVGA